MLATGSKCVYLLIKRLLSGWIILRPDASDVFAFNIVLESLFNVSFVSISDLGRRFSVGSSRDRFPVYAEILENSTAYPGNRQCIS